MVVGLLVPQQTFNKLYIIKFSYSFELAMPHLHHVNNQYVIKSKIFTVISFLSSCYFIIFIYITATCDLANILQSVLKEPLCQPKTYTQSLLEGNFQYLQFLIILLIRYKT